MNMMGVGLKLESGIGIGWVMGNRKGSRKGSKKVDEVCRKRRNLRDIHGSAEQAGGPIWGGGDCAWFRSYVVAIQRKDFIVLTVSDMTWAAASVSRHLRASNPRTHRPLYAPRPTGRTWCRMGWRGPGLVSVCPLPSRNDNISELITNN